MIHVCMYVLRKGTWIKCHRVKVSCSDMYVCMYVRMYVCMQIRSRVDLTMYRTCGSCNSDRIFMLTVTSMQPSTMMLLGDKLSCGQWS